MVEQQVVLPADSNQALGLAEFAIAFVGGGPGERGEPTERVLRRTELFHTDAVLCGVSAIALGAGAPTVLRHEALACPAEGGAAEWWAPGAARPGAGVLGSPRAVAVEKAVLANCAAVREWDSNGTNFGYSEERPHHRAGEFGHNDFYAVPVAAAQMRGLDGRAALLGMVLVDEVRGRLAEVFSLKSARIDHVLHGAIASAATFGAMMGASAEQIESAIGMVVAHAVPFRAIRHGRQLSDSKGASAAISTEFAIQAVKRSMAGFAGPRDIFRNPEAVFRLFAREGTGGEAAGDASPFDLVLSRAGEDFAVMGMHFKLGLYEHQSAGALQGLIDLLAASPGLVEAGGERIVKMVVRAYEPAFHIIGDPAKRDPRTRQSADHSMLYLVCTKLRKAIEAGPGAVAAGSDSAWKRLMLMPRDFTREAIFHPLTRRLMERMAFEWGGPEYDAKYPDGIPTSVVITDAAGRAHDSGLVMYPAGHARNREADLRGILAHKFGLLGALAGNEGLPERLAGLESRSEVAGLYDFEIVERGRFE